MDNYNVKSEYNVEQDLMKTLDQLGYVSRIDLNNIKKIEDNLKNHLERLNVEALKDTTFSDEEFLIHVKNKIINNSIFQNAQLFRDLIRIPKGQNENIRLKCFDEVNLNNNIFEYSHQVWQDSRNGNRGDVTLFMNGFPIVQIELKRSGIDLTEAFNQIIRYKQEAFDKNIFKMLQLFIISNETLTKYFSNNIKLNPKFAFNWSDNNNEKIVDLNEFAISFLNKDTLLKMLTDYMVLKSTTKEIVTLRPYQYYAVESILKHIEDTNDINNQIEDLEERAKKLNGYIWHATGSGKTLTSFKAAQILSNNPKIYKVVFLVDRNDLNRQTIEEFKGFLGVDSNDLEETENSNVLARQLVDKTTKIIVTTIQKLHNVLINDISNFYSKNKELFMQNFIFIIDECHRTQFGDMHKKLRKTFLKSRLIGFTGTPIFAKNQKNSMTTGEIFGLILHKYMMVDAIDDVNVLRFIIEYIKYSDKKIVVDDSEELNQGNDINELYKTDKYHEKIVDYIFEINSHKTKNNAYKSMLVCSDISSAIKYYWLFREKYPDFKVATLFSKRDNNEIVSNENDENIKFSRTELDQIIQDYNKVYDTNCSEIEFKNYSGNIQSKIIDKAITINLVIVVRMLTTGFNAKYLNTIYLDRNIKDYEIIQTISRANRICEPSKDYANVVSFRTYKEEVDKAILLYSDGDASNQFLDREPLESLIAKINKEIDEMKSKWPTYHDVVNEQSETRIKEFIMHMKDINKWISHAKNFINYNNNMISLTPKELEEFRSVQEDIYTKVIEKVYDSPILEDIDFELAIFKTDKIDVDYIISLLDKLKLKSINNEIDFKIEAEKIKEKIKDISLKSKADLLYKFISLWTEKTFSDKENDWKNKDASSAYREFRIDNIKEMISSFAKEYDLNSTLLRETIDKKFSENKPLSSYNDNIRNTINNKDIGYIDRKYIEDKIKEFITNINNDYYLEIVEKDTTHTSVN